MLILTDEVKKKNFIPPPRSGSILHQPSPFEEALKHRTHRGPSSASSTATTDKFIYSMGSDWSEEQGSKRGLVLTLSNPGGHHVYMCVLLHVGLMLCSRAAVEVKRKWYGQCTTASQW